MIDALLFNGPVGVGKSAAAFEAFALETSEACALIDVDELRRFRPAPADDPFGHAVAMANLRAVAAVYRDAGATRFVLAGVVEARAAVDEYRGALGADRLTVCRLTATPEAVRSRLEGRHALDPEGLAWHLARTVELEAILASAEVDDFVVDTTGLVPTEVALRVRRAAGWSSSSRAEGVA